MKTTLNSFGLITIIFLLFGGAIKGQNFTLHSNGITVVCYAANDGDSGEVNGVVYTKRSKEQITESNASTTCTSGITDMSFLFDAEGDETPSTFNEDISHWDMSSVTTTKNMFHLAKAFNQNVSAWDVSSVTDMGGMFSAAYKFNQDLSSWDVSNVTDMNQLFSNANDFNSPLNSWDVSQVTSMHNMFSGTGQFNQPLNEWDVSSVTDMSGVFQASKFNQDISNWNVSSVNDMGGMFLNSQFNQSIDLWDVSSVTKMNQMFTQSVFNNPIDNWDVSSVTNMFGMFSWYSKFNQDISTWDVSSVQIMDEMFRNADFDKNISDWCVSNITTEPSLIFENNSIKEAHKPIWGTCPEIQGTDEIPLYIPTNGLVAWYPFNGNANDESGNGNNGTVNGATLTTDKDGNENSAYLFDGVDDFISTDLIVPTLNAARTVSFWFKGSIGDILSSGGGGCFEGFNLTLAENEFYVEVACGLNSYPLEGIELIEWNQVFVVVKPNSSKLSDVKVYLNGVELAPQSSDEVELNTGNEPLNIGSHFSEAYNFFNGSIDDVAIWNRALSNDEIIALHNETNQQLSDLTSKTLSLDISYSKEGYKVSNYLSLDALSASDSLVSYQFDMILPVGIVFDSLKILHTESSPSYQTNLEDNTLSVVVTGSGFITTHDPLMELFFTPNTTGNFFLEATNIKLNSTPITNTQEGLMIIDPFVAGDVDDSGEIDGYDASIILHRIIGSNLLPSDPVKNWEEGPWFNWRDAAADVDGDGELLALDASLISQYVVGLINDFSNTVEEVAPVVVEVTQNGLRLTAPENIQSLSLDIPETNSVEFKDPVIDWDKSVLAYNNENGIKLALASSEHISGNFLDIPLNVYSSEDVTIEFTSVTNNIKSTHQVTVNSFTVNNERFDDMPNEYILGQNYPNPFNPSTQIQYSLPENTFVTLEIFNSVGQQVAQLVNAQKSAGNHVVNFDASGLSSGVFLYRLTTPSFVQTKKMLLIK